MVFLFSTLWVVLLLYIWFNTSAFPEYVQLLTPKKEGGLIATYIDCVSNGPFIAFPDFLYEHRPSFFTKILSCPFCSGLYLSLFLSVITFKSILPTATLFVSALLLYRLLAKIKLT